MKIVYWLGLIALSVPLVLAGCTGGGAGQQKGTSENLAESEVEYYCPMHPHPQIVREKPDRCPICNMPMSRRKAAVTNLNPGDRQLVEAQMYCPIRQDNHLGTMGTPFKVMIEGQPVFLCCETCQEKALANPAQTLAQVQQLKAKAKRTTESARSPVPDRPPTREEQAEVKAAVKAALGKLSPEDRRLAEAQGFCPVMEKNELGAMGKPFKVMIEDQAVFLCCPACKEKALSNPDQTLAKVEQLKARAKAVSPRK